MSLFRHLASSATHPCGSRSWPDPLIRSSGWRWAATTSRCRPWPRYGGRARNTRQVGPTNATPCWPRCGWRSGPSSCGQSERRCLPPSTGWLTAYSSRRSCSRHCFAAFWSPPPATCSPSSLCARWPPRHSRPGYRRDGSHWESSAGPWWCGCSARACRSSVSPC
ncbi:Uncharacterised protein [Mycobacterium tuberculosis]|nr:Uncharacterised protein [Mycobacterium tuberculosis]